MTITIDDRFLLRAGDEADLIAGNPTPLERELWLVRDVGLDDGKRKLKIGDGVTPWNDLPYLAMGGGVETIVEGANVVVDNTDPTHPIINATGGVGGAMTLVGMTTVSGSAATDMTISGLNLNAARRYQLQASLKAAASNPNINLFYNADNTASHYYGQSFFANGASSGASRVNTSLMAGMAAVGESIMFIADIIVDINGNPRAWINVNRGVPASISFQQFAHIWNSIANVTSITINSSVASALAVGSYMKLYSVN